MSASKRKGTAAESTLVRWFQAHGWPFCERRALTGSKDKGDLTGMPGLVVESKNAARIDLPGWMRETECERANANADFAVLVVKCRGYGDTRVGEWAAVMPLEQMTRLLHAAGYGDAPREETA